MNFLERLYTYGIMPRECHNRPDCSEYDKLGKQSEALQEQLQRELSKEQAELLEQLLETQLSIQAFYQYNLSNKLKEMTNKKDATTFSQYRYNV